MPNYRNAHDTAHQMDGAHWRNELCLLVPRSISLAQTAGSTLTIPSQYPQHVPRQTRSAAVSVGATSLAVRQVLHPAKKSKTAINAFDMLSDNASIKLMLTSSKGSKGRGSKDKNEIRSPKHFTPKSSPQNHLIFVIIFRLFVGFPADLTRRHLDTADIGDNTVVIKFWPRCWGGAKVPTFSPSNQKKRKTERPKDGPKKKKRNSSVHSSIHPFIHILGILDMFGIFKSLSRILSFFLYISWKYYKLHLALMSQFVQETPCSDTWKLTTAHWEDLPANRSFAQWLWDPPHSHSSYISCSLLISAWTVSICGQVKGWQGLKSQHLPHKHQNNSIHLINLSHQQI